MTRKVLALGAASAAAALAGVFVLGLQASADTAEFSAKLRDPEGRVVGTVEFRVGHDAMHAGVSRP